MALTGHVDTAVEFCLKIVMFYWFSSGLISTNSSTINNDIYNIIVKQMDQFEEMKNNLSEFAHPDI